MMEYDSEPIRGLPGYLPPGEAILWQSAPDWRLLARSAFHLPLVAVYFAALFVAGLIAGSTSGALLTLASGAACLALLAFLAWAIARSTVYTLTDRRIVMRFGIALPKCVNLPLPLIGAADLRPQGHGRGDVALRMTAPPPLSWLLMWPHVRPWRVRNAEPMLRSLPNAEGFAELLARAVAKHAPITVADATAVPSNQPVPAGAPAGFGA